MGLGYRGDKSLHEGHIHPELTTEAWRGWGSVSATEAKEEGSHTARKTYTQPKLTEAPCCPA